MKMVENITDLFDDEFKGHLTSATAFSSVKQLENIIIGYIADAARSVLMYSLILAPREMPFQIPEQRPILEKNYTKSPKCSNI